MSIVLPRPLPLFRYKATNLPELILLNKFNSKKITLIEYKEGLSKLSKKDCGFMFTTDKKLSDKQFEKLKGCINEYKTF